MDPLGLGGSGDLAVSFLTHQPPDQALRPMEAL